MGVSLTKTMTLSKELDKQIENYDFEYIESYLGAAVPSVLKELYFSGEVFELENIIVEEEVYICIANWEPLNKKRYEKPWPGTENFFELCSGWVRKSIYS